MIACSSTPIAIAHSMAAPRAAQNSTGQPLRVCTAWRKCRSSSTSHKTTTTRHGLEVTSPGKNGDGWIQPRGTLSSGFSTSQTTTLAASAACRRATSSKQGWGRVICQEGEGGWCGEGRVAPCGKSTQSLKEDERNAHTWQHTRRHT